MHNMPRMYHDAMCPNSQRGRTGSAGAAAWCDNDHDVLICGRSPHFSAGNEIYFIKKIPTPRNILSDNTNLFILYTKYILKILARRKYKELSKRKNFV